MITGASAGIGRATAIAFARKGARLGLIARNPEALEDTRREVEAAGGSAIVLPADVADAAAVEQAAAAAEQAFGTLDVWVNSAMITAFSPFIEMTPEEFRRITEVTYLGQVYGTLSALRRMRHQRRGTIVQVGSALAYRSIPLQSAYCGAKHAIRGFTDSLRSELLRERSPVRLSMVQLPAFNTPQFDWARNRMPRKPQPVPPIFQPEWGGEAIVRAAETAPRELWVGGQATMAIIGGMVAPGWLDRLLSKRAYEGQMSEEPAEPGAKDNLFEPLPASMHSAHGRFNQKVRPPSVMFTQGAAHLGAGISALGTVLAGGLLGYWFGKNGRTRE